MNINEAISRVISAERSAAHMTIKVLATESGIPERTLIRVLKGERDINVIQIAKLAPAFGLYPHEIVESAEKLIDRAERGKIPDYQEKDSDESELVADRAERALDNADNGIDIYEMAELIRKQEREEVTKSTLAQNYL